MATVTLLQLKGELFERMGGLRWEGTATGGAAGYVEDSSLINLLTDDFPFDAKRKQVRVTSGSADGDLRLVVDTIDREKGRFRPNRNFSGAVASTDTYELWSASIDGGTPLTNLFNYVLRQIRPTTKTRLSVEKHQDVYAVTSLADALEDVIEVWERTWDNKVGGDYNEESVWGWKPFRLAGAGTPTLHVRFPEPPRVSATTTLNGAHNSSITTITVTATADTPSPDVDFPSSGRLKINDELIDYTGTTSTTFTGCTRGVQNSTAASHSSADTVDVANGTYYFVEHHTPFTALASDTSTIDAIYRDWVVWETVFEFARQRSIHPSADRAYWNGLIGLASDALLQLRPRFMPLEPTVIRATV